jgi:hypothetical protein
MYLIKIISATYYKSELAFGLVLNRYITASILYQEIFVITVTHSYDNSDSEDLPEELRSGTTVLQLGTAEFDMTTKEWVQLKTFISEGKQEQAMRWWADRYSTPFSKAVGIINRIQVCVEFNLIS